MSEILPSRGLSLPTKIFFSFAAIIVAFGLTMGYTLVRQRRTLHDMTFISGGLLPVTLTVAEVRNTQELLVTTLESDPERRVQWLALVRQLRPVSLRRTAQSTRQAGQLAPSPEVTELMQELAVELEDVAVEALEQEPEYHELFEAFETGDEAQAQAVLESIIRREREVSGRLERVQGRIDAQITEIARNMARDERQLLWALLFLTIGALIVAAGLTFLSYRAVAPLSRLTAGVAAVGAGNLEQRVDIDRSDEIGTLAREFNRMTERLIEREQQLLRSERLAAIGKFVAKVTHDIRNPISSMGMSAEMLQEDITLLLDEEDRKEPLENLATITERLEYLEKLTSEYLAFARPTRPSLEPRDLDDQVENALNSESISFEASNIELHLVLSYELPPVRLDEVQFRRALSNLVRNACEAMEDGGRLTIRSRAIDDGIELKVEDDGAGMEPGEVERIFDHFYTTKERGTGLGLPNAQDIIALHGGRLTCRSQEGEGTTFTIWLPAYSGNADLLDDGKEENEGEKDETI